MPYAGLEPYGSEDKRPNQLTTSQPGRASAVAFWEIEMFALQRTIIDIDHLTTIF